MASIAALAEHDDVLTARQVRKPSREQFGGAKASTAAHLIWIRERRENAVSMLREEVRVTLGYMSFALAVQLRHHANTGKQRGLPHRRPRVSRAYAPATVRSSTLRVGASAPALNSRSSAATRRAQMSFRLPATVLSLTRKAISPFSTHKPPAPRLSLPATAFTPMPI